MPPGESEQSPADLPTPSSTPTKDNMCVMSPSLVSDTPHKIQLVIPSGPLQTDQQREDCLGKENCVRGNVQPCQQHTGQDEMLLRRLCDSPKPTQPKLTKCEISESCQTRKGRKGRGRPRNPAGATSATEPAKVSTAKTTANGQAKNKPIAPSKPTAKM